MDTLYAKITHALIEQVELLNKRAKESECTNTELIAIAHVLTKIAMLVYPPV